MNRLAQVKGLAGLVPKRQFEGQEEDGSSSYTSREGTIPSHGGTFAVTLELPVSEADRRADDKLNVFFKEVEELKGLIAEMEKFTMALKEKHAVNQQTLNQEIARKLREEIKQLSSQSNERASTAKGKLDSMSKDISALKENEQTLHANSAIVRIQENLHRYLLTKLMQATESYRKLQMSSEASYKEHAKRQIKIMYRNSENVEIDDDAADELAQQVLQNNLTSYIFQQSKEVLATVIETRNDIYRIEHTMRELNRMFTDLAILVEEQDQLIDTILVNIRRSARYVEASLGEIKKAKKHSRKVTKKMICLAVTVGVVLLMFVLIILASTISV